MSVFQRSDGRWCAKVKDESYTPPKWIQRTFKTKQEAEQYEDECKSDSREGSRLTVFEAVALYLKTHDLCKVVQWQYRWLVTGSDKPTAKKRVGYAQHIASKYVDCLNRRDLESVRDCCREGGCCNRSINDWVGKLNAAFNYAVEEGLLQSSPWASFKNLPETRNSMTGSLDAFQKVYQHLPAWFQWACRTAIALALRPGIVELFRLKWESFDFRHGSVRVWMGKVGQWKTVYPVAEYLAEAWKRFCEDGQDKSLFVCRNSRGKPVFDYAHAWSKAVELAGVGYIPFYSIRHITATESLAAGADIAAVAANLGHANPSTTLKIYAHALPSAQKAASASVGALWCKPALPEPEKSGS